MTDSIPITLGLIQPVISLKNGLELILTFLILLQLVYLTLKVKRSPLFWSHFGFLLALLFHFIILNTYHYFGVVVFQPYLFYPFYGYSIMLATDFLKIHQNTKSLQQSHILNIIQLLIGLGIFFLTPVEYELNSLHLVIVLLIALQKGRRVTHHKLKRWLIRTIGFMILLVGVFPITLFLTTIENYLIFKFPYAIIFVIFLIQNFYSFLGNPRFFIAKEKTEATPSKQLLSKLIDALEVKKLYKKQALTLNELSHEIQEPVYKISRTLNQHYGKSFPELINHLRISDIKERLIREDCKTLKIEALAYEVGFNTPSSFYVAFKKELGTTPRAFRHSLSNPQNDQSP